jgi:hypothetical protein
MVNGNELERVYPDWEDLNEHAIKINKNRYSKVEFLDALGRQIHVVHHKDGRLEMSFAPPDNR